MADTNMKLEDLKKVYKEYEKKYKLPSFEELNTNFEIEKIEKESDILLRIVRVVMMEKIIATQRFVESILVPGNAPKALYSYTKSMGDEDKATLDKIYDSFSKITLEALELDVEYKESKEAEIIKKIIALWNETKKKLYPIFAKMRNPGKQETRKEKSYFG